MSNNLFAEKHYKLQLKNKSGNITHPEEGFSEIYVDENTKRITLLNSSGEKKEMAKFSDTFIPSNGDLSGSLLTPKVIKIQGKEVSSTQPAVNQTLQWDGSSWVPSNIDSLPTGSVIAVAHNQSSVPGYLYCDGSPVSKTTYSALWNVLSIQHNCPGYDPLAYINHNSRYFRLPTIDNGVCITSIIGYRPCGFSYSPGFPINNQKASMIIDNSAVGLSASNENTMPSGCWRRGTIIENGYDIVSSGPDGSGNWMTFDASRCSLVYGRYGTRFQPPAVRMRYYIKY